jgi:choline dehydrogenase-like flavoprotein
VAGAAVTGIDGGALPDPGKFRRSTRPPPDPASPEAPLTAAERRLHVLLRALVVFFMLIAPLYVIGALTVPGQVDWAQVGFAVNSPAKDLVFALACAVAAANVRRFDFLIPLVVVGHLFVIAAAAIVLIAADTSATYHVLGTEVSLTAAIVGAIVVDAIVTVLLLAFYLPARRSRYLLKYLKPIAFDTLAALAEVTVVRDEEAITPEEVARNVDRYIGKFDARRKWVIPGALTALYFYPLLTLRGPFPLLAPEERRKFVEKLLSDVGNRRVHFLRNFVQAAIRLASQMVYLGYYGDERTHESVGYAPFSKRPRAAAAVAAKALPVPPLRTMNGDDVAGDTIEADYVVVGSGAGGGMVAYRLAEAGCKVLVIEGGKHVDPRDFTEDEVHQLTQLYADGALQQSRDFSFAVLQGKCVGGSTTVNNAVCFDLPETVLEHWNGPLAAGIDKAGLRASFSETRRLMRIGRPPSEYLEGGFDKFVAGVHELGLDQPPFRMDVVDANIHDCPGAGYCNIGCPFGNKLSMLVTLLPEAQRRFGADALRILPECLAEKIEHRNGRADAVLARLGNRRVRIRARKAIIVSGGAVASPWLLMRSRIARGRAGRRISFNMGSPITAYYADELVDSFDGVQISHFLEPPGAAGYVFETWFNPVVSQALNMPGWLDDHWRNMHRFRNLTAAGVLVGTTTEEARIRPALTGGADIVYEPGRGDKRNVDDMHRLIEGLKLLGRIFLASGATSVMPNTVKFHEFTRPEQLDELDRYIVDARDLSVGTGHPQGGNAISTDPARGVVGPDCRVHGFDNLFVCDASVFPSSTTVNPQLTVMSVANMAAPGIAAA